MDTRDIDLAWLAGFIDGEGSFHFRRQAGKRAGGFNYYYPAIRIANTFEETLAAVRSIADRAELHYLVYWRHPTNGNRSSWDLEARGAKTISKWLTLLIPFLRTKRSQAEDVQRFLELRAADTSFRDYSPEELEILQRMSKRGTIRPRENVPVAARQCINGHLLEGDNLYFWNGRRWCRACRSAQTTKQAAKNKEKRRLAREGKLTIPAPTGSSLGWAED